MSSRMEQIIEEIEEYISSCKYAALSSNKILVNKEELEELIQELRTKTPEEIKRYQKIISNKDYVPKKRTVMALGLALELPLEEYERFLASAGYAFMPSSKFDLIIKYCVMNHIYNLINVDVILDDHGEECFAPS